MESDDFQELLIRWFQFGTFLPVMRLHGLRMPGQEIINKSGEVREWTGADNEVWSYGEKNCEIMTKFIRIREMMRDYTRSLMAQAHTDGTPVMRTLFYEFPEDKSSWDIKDQFMYGPDILVAPVCYEHANSREVYLPQGAEWVNAHDGKTYQGGKTYQIDAPIDTIPVFLKNGGQEYLIHQI